MAAFDTGWQYRDGFYLNVPYQIRIEGSADRVAGTNNVRFHGTYQIRQASGTYGYEALWGYGDGLGDTQFKERITSYVPEGTVWSKGFDFTENRGVDAGSRTLSFTAYNKGTAGQQLGDLQSTSVSASYDSGVASPATPSISGTNIDSYTNQITYGTSSFGNPSSGTVYLYGGTSPDPTTQIKSKTTTGNSTVTLDNLEPNTTYYYRARAHNGKAWSGYSQTITVKTKAATLVPYPNDPERTNTAKYAKKMEAPLNGLARNVKKLYRSNGGVAQRIY